MIAGVLLAAALTGTHNHIGPQDKFLTELVVSELHDLRATNAVANQQGLTISVSASRESFRTTSWVRVRFRTKRCK